MTALASIRMLQPRPIGEDWQAYTGVSPYGALRRAWRANALERHDVRSVLGIIVHREGDLFQRCMSSAVIRQRLQLLYPAIDARGWNAAGWWPFGGRMPADLFMPQLRECPSCAKSAYHSLLFQMPGVSRCPWHGTPLVTHCTACSSPLQAGLRYDMPPGKCTCGHDMVNMVSAVIGHRRDPARIEDYLEWAVSARGQYWLFAPELPDPRAQEALDLLLPQGWAWVGSSERAPHRAGGVILERVTLSGSPRDTVPRLSESSGLETFNPGTACLPLGWAREFVAIGRNLNSDLPEAARRDAAEPGSDVKWALSRLPVTVAGRTLFLQTECLERTALRLLSRLAAGFQVNDRSRSRRPPPDDHFGHWLRQNPRGTLLLEKVIKRLVLRGYADGARVSLGRHVPALYDRSRGRPATRYPWVLLWLPRSRDEAPSARIVWTRQSGTA